MSRESDLVHGITIPTVVGTVCCVFTGLLWKVFSPHLSLFAFTVDGFVGSLLFFLLRAHRVRDGLAMLLVTWLLQAVLLTNDLTRFPWPLVNVLFFAIGPAAVYVFFDACYEPRRWAGAWSPLTLGLLAAACTIPVTIAVAYLEWPGENPWHLNGLLSMLWLTGRWFALGVGLGAGVALTEYQPVQELLSKREI